MNGSQALNCSNILPNSSGLNEYRNVCISDMEAEANRKYGIGAGSYVIIVIVFYGTSVMFLIASHINRKHQKILEDRQIDSYLKEFQVVRETSSRDDYRTLKRNMIAYLIRIGLYGAHNNNISSSALYRCLSKTLIPMTAIALSPAGSMTSLQSRRNSGESSVLTVPNRNPLHAIQECEEHLNSTESPRDDKEKESRSLFTGKLAESPNASTHSDYFEKQVNFLENENEDGEVHEQGVATAKISEPEKTFPVTVNKFSTPNVQFPNKQLTPNWPIAPPLNISENIRPLITRQQIRSLSSEYSRPKPYLVPNYRSQHSYPTSRRDYYDVMSSRHMGSNYSSVLQRQGRYGNRFPNPTSSFIGNAQRKNTIVEPLEQISTV